MIEFVQATDKVVPEMNAGSQVRMNGGAASMGYRARRAGVNGIVTTGYFPNQVVGSTLQVGSATVGTVRARQFSGSVDAAFVQITNNNFTPSNSIQRDGDHFIYSNK